ncbi:Nuclear receptor domain-containing protein [Aphelenchoides fujianensis]|nr:Nuclear receptor domain-containing protein [Aphelenchoides fujianensis]
MFSEEENPAVPNRELRCLVCNEDATFVRRTIKQGRSYVCALDGNCSTEHRSKRVCMACRYKKCLEKGVNVQFVVARHRQAGIPQLRAENADDKLLQALTAAFNRSLQETQETSMLNQRMQVPGEMTVLLSYLKHSGLHALFDLEANLHDFCIGFFLQWNLLSACWLTLRNDGLDRNRCYTSDECHIPVNREAIERWFQFAVNPYIKRPGFVSQKFEDLLVVSMRSMRSFHANGMNLSDFSILCQLTALRTAIASYPNNTRLKTQLNRLFRTIQRFFGNSNDGPSLRIGSLVLLISEMEVAVVRGYTEWEVLMQLNSQMAVPNESEQEKTQRINVITSVDSLFEQHSG